MFEIPVGFVTKGILTHSLCLRFSNMPFIVFRVHQFRDDLSGMDARIKMIRVCQGFTFTPLFTTMTGEYILVVIVDEVLVFVKEMGRHSSWLFKKNMLTKQRKHCRNIAFEKLVQYCREGVLHGSLYRLFRI